LRLVRLRRSLRQIGGPLQQHRRRRRLGDGGVGPVRVDGDDDGDDEPFVLGRLGIEVLAEVHDIDAVGTERGPDRRRGGGLPPPPPRSGASPLPESSSPLFLVLPPKGGSSRYSFSTCKKSNSTGVDRPKIV